MKVGDKVLCKKDFIPIQNNYYDRMDIIFKKDKYYKIDKIQILQNKNKLIYLYGESNKRYWFDIDVDGKYNFNDHFLTNKQIRKIKLNEIKKRR